MRKMERKRNKNKKKERKWKERTNTWYIYKIQKDKFGFAHILSCVHEKKYQSLGFICEKAFVWISYSLVGLSWTRDGLKLYSSCFFL